MSRKITSKLQRYQSIFLHWINLATIIAIFPSPCNLPCSAFFLLSFQRVHLVIFGPTKQQIQLAQLFRLVLYCRHARIQCLSFVGRIWIYNLHTVSKFVVTTADAITPTYYHAKLFSRRWSFDLIAIKYRGEQQSYRHWYYRNFYCNYN
jgi:hypothetical protein